MKSLLKSALALAALTCSANAQALFSVCLEVGPNAVYFGAHATYSGLLSPVVIHADSYVSGSDFRTGFTRSVARGFRNMGRFRDAIYFHHGGLDMLPAGVEL